MSDDEINWESAFSDDSLDEKIDETAESLAGDPTDGECSDATEPANDAVPEIIEQTAAATLAGLTEDPSTSTPRMSPPAAQPSEPKVAVGGPQVTQQMPAAALTPAPPPVSDKGGGLSLKKVGAALAVVVPLAIAAFMYFGGGDDPKEALPTLPPSTDSPADTAVTNATETSEDNVATDSSEAPGDTEVSIVETVPPLSFVYPTGINDVAPDGALASGCTPGSDTVPDGIWFVLLSSWSSEAVTVDFSCAYTGATADAQAVLRGELVQQPKIYLTNDNQKLRTVSFASDATLIVPPQVAAEFGYEQSYASDVLDPVLGVIDSDLGGKVPLFLFVNNGVLTEMVVQNPDAVQIAVPLLPTLDSNCPPDQEPPTPVVEVAGIPANDPDGGLNIRVAPVVGTILFAAPNGTALTVTGGCELIDGLAWWQIQTPDSTGWASSQYLVPSGD